LDHHDFATAFDLFDRALAISNSNVAALGISAVALAWMGRTQGASERALRALRLSPFHTLHSFTYNALAVAAFHEGRYADARDAARRGVEINPKFSVPRVLLAASLVRLGQLAEAQAEARHVLALRANRPGAAGL
jgi:Flp pilus assembly protein TadD